MTVIDDLARAWMNSVYQTREEAIRAAVERSLPTRLGWLVDHPRLLKWVFRVRPSWQPRIVMGSDLGNTVTMVWDRTDTLTVLDETFDPSEIGY